MEDPQLEARKLRDRVIQVILNPIFETVSEQHRQEWLREMAGKLGMSTLQFNGFLRQVWNKNSVAPQLQDTPPAIIPPIPVVQFPPSTTPPFPPNPRPFTVTVPPQPLIPVTETDTPLSPTGYRKYPNFKISPTSPPPPPPGPSPVTVWENRLMDIINGDIFGSVPEYQRLEYLSREYNNGLKLGAIRDINDLNSLIVRRWKNNAPEIPQVILHPNGQPQYGSVKNLSYTPPSPFRKDVTYVGDKQFINLGRVRDQVFGFAKTVQDKLTSERKRQHQLTGSPRGWPLESDLMELIDDINTVVREIWYREGQYLSVTIPLVEYVTTMQSWTDRYNAIVKELGRRHCINTHDPFDGTPVDEIPDGEYIRLANGICWHILSLMEFIRGNKGRNTPQGLSNYPTATLWNREIDFPRILRHPLVKKTDFEKWYKEKTAPKEVAERISVETLNRMERTGGLLRSVGPDFLAELRRRLSPELLAIFQREAGGDPDSLSRIRNVEAQNEITRVIKQDIKSVAMMEFTVYWDGLSEEEKEAILAFEPKLQENLAKCLKDDYCVFGMGNDFLITRNEIAVSKRIPTKNYGISFE